MFPLISLSGDLVVFDRDLSLLPSLGDFFDGCLLRLDETGSSLVSSGAMKSSASSVLCHDTNFPSQTFVKILFLLHGNSCLKIILALISSLSSFDQPSPRPWPYVYNIIIALHISM